MKWPQAYLCDDVTQRLEELGCVAKAGTLRVPGCTMTFLRVWVTTPARDFFSFECLWRSCDDPSTTWIRARLLKCWLLSIARKIDA